MWVKFGICCADELGLHGDFEDDVIMVGDAIKSIAILLSSRGDSTDKDYDRIQDLTVECHCSDSPCDAEQSAPETPCKVSSAFGVRCML